MRAIKPYSLIALYVALRGNVMFLGENWYLGVKLVVGRESPVVGGKQAG